MCRFAMVADFNLHWNKKTITYYPKIVYKILLQTFRSQHGTVPPNLAELLDTYYALCTKKLYYITDQLINSCDAIMISHI